MNDTAAILWNDFDCQSSYEEHVHAPYKRQRRAIVKGLCQAIADAEEPEDSPRYRELVRTARRLTHCCRAPAVCTNETGSAIRIVESRCRHRACPRCSARRARALTPRLMNMVRTMDDPKFLTLTVRASNRPLKECIAHLRAAFTRLRASKFWRTHVRGGVGTLEAKIGQHSGHWHPHFHLIIDAKYMKLPSLRAAWKQASRDSEICCVKKVYGIEGIARYLMGYVVKGSNAEKLPDWALPEWLEGMRSQRTLATFGSMHGVKIDDDEETLPACNTPVAQLVPIIDAARAGDEHARGMWEELCAVRRVPRAERGSEYEARIIALVEAMRKWSHERTRARETEVAARCVQMFLNESPRAG
jgi:hypothetical protein